MCTANLSHRQEHSPRLTIHTCVHADYMQSYMEREPSSWPASWPVDCVPGHAYLEKTTRQQHVYQTLKTTGMLAHTLCVPHHEDTTMESYTNGTFPKVMSWGDCRFKDNHYLTKDATVT